MAMLYDSLKIFHIISATLLLTSIVYCINLWRKPMNGVLLSDRIQTQTWLVILPFALLQLATGFTMISLKHYGLADFWVTGSVIGFIIVIMSWFAFIYFLLSAQHTSDKSSWRRLQTGALTLGSLALLSMIYFMANKITSP
jgi:hypothetical protein